MSYFMFFFSILISYLYICSLASALSVTEFTGYLKQTSTNGDHSTKPILSTIEVTRVPNIFVVTNASGESNLGPPSIIEDLLKRNPEQMLDSNNELENTILANRSDSSFDSIDFGLYPTSNNNNNQAPTSTLINQVKNDDSSNELEEVEMHTNNHQSSGNGNQNYHSRLYNKYQLQGNSLNAPHSSLSHYNKFIPSRFSPSSYTKALNLNYIHNLLPKPANTNNLVNLLNSNLNSLLPSSSPSSPSQYASSPSPSSSPSSPSSGRGSATQNAYTSHHYHSPLLTSLGAIQQQPSHTTLIQPQSSQATLIPDSQSFSTTGAESQQQPSDQFSGSPMCGRQQVGSREPRIISSREPRIVGGNSTYEGEFPWAVSIQRHGNHHCGGVIVGKRWILTAAHCVRSQLVGNLIVRTGGHTLTRSSNHINSHLERDYFVDQIVMHGDFSRYDNLTASQLKSSANTNNADIALLRLKHDIHWNEFAWPVCFPSRESGNFSGRDAVVIGWGKLNEKSEDFSNELQKVKLTIIDNKVCQNWFRQAGRDMPIDDRIICAGFKNGGKDACHGDSGGPLLSKINGHYVVVGVVSTGIGCARPLLPGLYSRVSSYISWIESYVT